MAAERSSIRRIGERKWLKQSAMHHWAGLKITLRNTTQMRELRNTKSNG